MARKCKVGIDYFSHDVHCTSDRKLKLIKAKYGVVGYGIYFLLLEEIYKEGYCIHLDDEFNILFVSDHNLEEDVYINCLNDCIKFGLFNDIIYKKSNILTSKRIQENYLEASSRRKVIEIDVNILLLNVDILPQNVNISTQKKRKEKKGEEKREKIEEIKPLKKERILPTYDQAKEYWIEKVKVKKETLDNITLNRNKVMNGFQTLWDYYNPNWRDGKGKNIKDWKKSITGWINRDVFKYELKEWERTS